MFDPVVRLTGKTPVPNGGGQRNRLAVEGELPIRRVQRSHYFIPASAAALVAHSRKLHGNIERTLLQSIRDILDEFMAERFFLSHGNRPPWQAIAVQSCTCSDNLVYSPDRNHKVSST